MSYSSVCQGLQSYLEPRLIEPRTLNLKLAPPPSEFPSSSRSSSSFFSTSSESDTYEKPPTKTSTNTLATTNDEHVAEWKTGWSFLQSLSNISHFDKTEGLEAENVYVHPAFKHSSSMFNAESLELCTESLGSESGSSNAGDKTDDNMSFFSSESRSSENFTTTSAVVKRKSESKKLNNFRSFPPPLTSMTELGGGVQVRSHREDGRLILEAVTSSSPQPYFQAERGNGRLTLRLFDSVDDSCCGSDDDEDECEVEALNNQESCVEEEDEVVEVGMKKFARPRRCKESEHQLFHSVYEHQLTS